MLVATNLLKAPVSLATGTVLENLLSNAAAWVRASDVVALLAVLGIPIPAPAGVKVKHPSNPGDLLHSLLRASKWKQSLQASARHLDLHVERFRERCFTSDFSVLSPISSAEELLQPAEKHLFDLARGLLADPEILIVHDMLNVMPLPLAENALEVLLLWQNLGGFKGLVMAFEGGFRSVDGYPAWITAGGISRSLFISESTIVCAGLRMTSYIASWLVIQPGGVLELESAEEVAEVPIGHGDRVGGLSLAGLARMKGLARQKSWSGDQG